MVSGPAGKNPSEPFMISPERTKPLRGEFCFPIARLEKFAGQAIGALEHFPI
jgi:hypothetical protein